jgi:hypothetical protein
MAKNQNLRERLFGPAFDVVGKALARYLRQPGVLQRVLILGFASLLVAAAIAAVTKPSLALQPARLLQLDKIQNISLTINDSDTDTPVPTRQAPTASPKPTPTEQLPSVSEVDSETTDGKTSGSLEAFLRITFPLDGASVPELSPFKGEFGNLPSDVGCLWLFIENPWNSLLFPQGRLWDKKDETFTRIVAIGAGNEHDQGKEFVVNVGTVPQVTCDEWDALSQPVGTPTENTKGQSEPILAIPPLKALPEGVVLYSSIKVVLDRGLGSSEPSNDDPAENK